MHIPTNIQPLVQMHVITYPKIEYIHSYEDDLMKRIAKIAVRMKKGSFFVTLTKVNSRIITYNQYLPLSI